MLVIYDLTSLSSCSGKSHTEDDVVKSALKHNHKVLTCLALHSVGFLVVVTERFLQNAINEFSFLFFS